LDHEPGADDLDDFVGPFVFAALFDEFVQREGGLLRVFSVLDVFAQVFEGVAVDTALYYEVEDCRQLVQIYKLMG
jgi:hypothetical protein